MKIRFTGNAAKAIEILQGKPMVIDGVVRWGGGGWVKTFEEDGRDVVYRPSHWEEVPPPKVWRDVTAECEFLPENGLPTRRKLFHGTHAQTCIGDFDKGYRLRKIERQDWGTYPPVAFIVEKSE